MAYEKGRSAASMPFLEWVKEMTKFVNIYGNREFGIVSLLLLIHIHANIPYEK